MSKWRNIKLRDIIEVKHGWPFKSSLFNENGDSSLPIVVGIGNFKYSGGFRFEETKANRYEGEYPVEYKLKPDDILLIMTCQTEGGEILGIPGKIPNSLETYLHNQRLGKVIVKDSDQTSPYFLYWHFISSDFNQQLFASATGTKILHTSPNRILDCSLIIPEIEEQKSIANVLDSISAKIDLLERQNKTLGQMAETLFRQWFVEGVNQDWKERALSSVAIFLNGLACQKFPPANDVDKLPVLKIKQLRGGFSDDFDWCSTEVKPEYIVEEGDVIFSWSASLMVKIWDGQKCILNQHLFKVTSEEFPKWFYYLWCKHHLSEFISISASHATTMGHIKRSDLDEAMVVVPDTDAINTYSETMIPLLNKVMANNRQLHNLTNLRDTLLPKLMSGEVTISDNG